VSDSPDVVKRAETYYDSSDADEFYFNVWGGEDIHVGLYETPGEPIAVASRRTVDHLIGKLGLDPADGRKVLDLGAGYGGAARILAREHRCHVTALNLSETQNRRNRELSAAQGLADLVDVVHGNFEELPFDDGAFDIVWSQDSILHSGKREQVLREARRVLKPGGQMVFTDPMQADDADPSALQPVYDRIHLDNLGSFAAYRAMADRVGFEVLEMEDLTPQLARHYSRVREELTGRYDEMCAKASAAYVDRMIAGLGHWVTAGEAGQLAWGVIHLRAK